MSVFFFIKKWVTTGGDSGDSLASGLSRDSESIEWFIEDQAFLLSYDSAPRPSPYPSSPASKLSIFLSLPVCRRSVLYWRGGGGAGDGRGAKSYDREKAWPSINHSILPGTYNVCIYIDIKALTYLRDTGIEIVNTKFVLQIIQGYTLA
jgi:hypothetical protein